MLASGRDRPRNGASRGARVDLNLAQPVHGDGDRRRHQATAARVGPADAVVAVGRSTWRNRCAVTSSSDGPSGRRQTSPFCRGCSVNRRIGERLLKRLGASLVSWHQKSEKPAKPVCADVCRSAAAGGDAGPVKGTRTGPDYLRTKAGGMAATAGRQGRRPRTSRRKIQHGFVFSCQQHRVGQRAGEPAARPTSA